ncbi:MAG: tetratricopeptide repeat protein [Syntrophaceae bacterium]|nr:tetratricopeptide repeat protein [Syntrophaceae bacterium]
MLSATLNNIGGVFWNQGDYQKALDYFHRSLKIKEEIGDTKSAALINNNIGLVYRQMGDYEMALKHFNISLQNNKIIGDSVGISSALLGIGDNYHRKGDYSKALESFQKSEEIRNKKHHEKTITPNNVDNSHGCNSVHRLGTDRT